MSAEIDGRTVPGPELHRLSREKAAEGAVVEAAFLALQSLEGRRDSPAHYENAARILHDAKLYKASALISQGALDRGLDKPVLHALLAKALSRLGRHDEAIAQFNVAIEQSPDNAGYLKLRETAARKRDGAGTDD